MGVPQARQFCEYALGMGCVPTTELGARDRGVEVIVWPLLSRSLGSNSETLSHVVP